MAVNYQRKRNVADRLIRKYGSTAKLRSATGERSCIALQVNLSAADRRALRADADSVHLISAVQITAAPDHQREQLVILDDAGADLMTYKITVPATPLNPGGYVIYWELETRGTARAV